MERSQRSVATPMTDSMRLKIVVSTINSTAAKTQGGGPWTMSTGSGAIDLVTVLYDGTNYYLIPQQDWS